MIYFIKNPSGVVLSGNDIEVIVQSEYYNTLNYTSVKTCLQVKDSTGTQFCLLNASPDESGHAIFNLKDLLINPLPAADFLSEDPSKTIALPEFSITAYETAWFENTFMTSSNVSPESFNVLEGGIAKELLPFSTSSLLNYFIYHRTFLSWQATTQYVNPDQNVKLYYLHNSNVGMRILKITRDGIETFTEIQLTYNQLIQIDVSTSFENTQIVKVAICNSVYEQINEEITYIINNSFSARPQTFVFKNSFGLFESVAARGMQNTTHEIKRAIYENDETAITTAAGSFTVKRGGLSKTMETEVGFVYEDDTERMIDFLNSDKTYLLNSGKLVPITILTEETVLQNDEVNGLYTMPFEWKYNFNEKFVGKMLPPKYEENEYNNPLLVNQSTAILIDDNSYLTWG